MSEGWLKKDKANVPIVREIYIVDGRYPTAVDR